VVLLRIRPQRVLLLMLAIAAVLTAITVVVHLIEPLRGRSSDSAYAMLVALPDAASEGSVANWYSAVVMLGCAGLMAWIGRNARLTSNGYSLHWLGLAVLFTFLSLDEGIGIHESLIEPLRNSLELGGVLYLGWIIPWGGLTIACAIAYSRFLIHLGPGVRAAIVAAAALFVAAALGLEMLEGQLYTSGEIGLPYEAAVIGEELGEMAALALLAYGLLRQLAGDRGGTLRIELVPTTSADMRFSPARLQSAPAPGRTRRRSLARSASP